MRAERESGPLISLNPPSNPFQQVFYREKHWSKVTCTVPKLTHGLKHP